MNIGYACIALGVRETGLKSLNLRNASGENLRTVTTSNLCALERLIEYNGQAGIKLFRISSDIIPFGSHPVNDQKWWQEQEETLCRIGCKIRDYGIRVSMHPGQYTVLNSVKEDVVLRAVLDLEYHARFLDSLGVEPAGKIILHIGGVFGDKEQSLERFERNYLSLADNIKKRLVIENDDKCYAIDSVLQTGMKLSIPVVFDNLHHAINPPEERIPELEWIKRCSSTWQQQDGRQKVHYSQQDPAGKPGAHSQSISIQPFLNFYRIVEEISPDIMLEVKDKNLSALKCILCTGEQMTPKALEMEWARYKYLVMERSYKLYSEISKGFGSPGGASPVWFYKKVEEALDFMPDRGNAVNAAQHVWGYFKSCSEENEKTRCRKLLSDFENGENSDRSLKSFLWKMTEKYQISYLIGSYYFL